MSIEVFGDREFIEAVRQRGGVWVLLAGRAAYALRSECGKALPVWPSEGAAALFAQGLGEPKLSPVFVPLEIFLGTGWLGSSTMDIADVLASPRYGHDSLTYSVEEIRARFGT